MKQENIITGESIDEIWQKINLQINENTDLLDYNVAIIQEGRRILLSIDIDLGGGFESGFETTTFTALLEKEPSFKFAIHQEHFSDEIGKFFGMQDVIVGYKEFDDSLIIKTNEKSKVRKLFSDSEVRTTIQSLPDFTFGITHHTEDGKQAYYLELIVEQGITNSDKLKEIYTAFYKVLLGMETGVASA